MKEKVIQTRATEDMHEKLQKLAQKKGLSISEYLRYLIIEAIEKRAI